MTIDIVRKKESFKILIAIFLYFIVSFIFGTLFLDFREINKENIDGFLTEMETPKAYSRYLQNLNEHKFCIEIPSYEIKRCFETHDKLVKIEPKDSYPTIILDEHAIGGIVHGTFNLKEVLFSEYIFGHIKLRNFSVIDNMMMLWKS